MFDECNRYNECIMPIVSATSQKGKKFLFKINSKEMRLVVCPTPTDCFIKTILPEKTGIAKGR